MSEENKRNAELNDAALEGVSGGTDGIIMMMAREICNNCPQSGQSCETKLVAYLLEYGAYLVSSSETCPFNNFRV